MKIDLDKIDLLIKESAAQANALDICNVQLMAVADLPTRFGDFQVIGFVSPCDAKEHTAIAKGDVVDKEGVLTRAHSECLTGDAIGSLRCDCRDQLIESLKRIEAEGEGVLLYLRQEGRNIGLTEKIRAYALQDQGFDTVEANIHLGHKPDERDYGIAANILHNLRVKSVRLLTNNPNKIQQLIDVGVRIIERVPLITEPTQYSAGYLKTKAEKSGHLFGNLSEVKDIEKILKILRAD
ncbi:MAG: GTP cyclohydrolase II [Candidatus Thorarchaeota archaeon]|jgi:GTP cyclohydrolase II